MSARAASTGAYTTLWAGDLIRRIRAAGLVGARFEITFGGPHRSAPSFSRAGVRPGDSLIPLHVKDGRLHVIAAMRVTEVLRVEEYVERDAELFEAVRGDPEFLRLRPHMDGTAQESVWLLRLWLSSHPGIAALCPGEATEVVLGESIVPIRLDRTVSPAVVPALRWRSGRGAERPIRHVTSDGHVARSLSLQGLYRLTPLSEALLLGVS